VISTGSASSSTGLAGRIRNAIDTFFSTFARDFSLNSVGDKGLNAFSQGMVDSFNNDGVGIAQQDPVASAAASAQIGNASWNNLAWGNVPNSSVTVSNISGTRKLRIDASLSFYTNGVSPPTVAIIRLLQDTNDLFTHFTFAYSVLVQHQGWSFSWLINAPASGTHTYVLSATIAPGNSNSLGTDSTDYVSMIVSEV
jgi:hypothetical protein